MLVVFLLASVRCFLFGVCCFFCQLFVVGCLLLFVCCLICLMFVVCCLLFVVCGKL